MTAEKVAQNYLEVENVDYAGEWRYYTNILGIFTTDGRELEIGGDFLRAERWAHWCPHAGDMINDCWVVETQTGFRIASDDEEQACNDWIDTSERPYQQHLW